MLKKIDQTHAKRLNMLDSAMFEMINNYGALLFDHTIMEGRVPFIASVCGTIYFIGFLEGLESHLQCGIYPGKDWGGTGNKKPCS